MSELSQSTCEGPRCVNAAAEWSPDKTLRLCGTHASQLRRVGNMSPVKRCMLNCGAAASPGSDICRACSKKLRERGEKWCSTHHGALPLEEFNKAGGKCLRCRREAARATTQRCALGCGSARYGKSDLCQGCLQELEAQGLRRCRTHGILPISEFWAERICIKCTMEARSDATGKELAKHGGRCGICAKSLTARQVRRDHDHSHGCGKSGGCSDCRRAILCNRCNGMLGRYSDDPATMTMATGKSSSYPDDLLKSGAAYLSHWNAIMIERGVRKRDLAAETMQWMAEQMKEFLAIVS